MAKKTRTGQKTHLPGSQTVFRHMPFIRRVRVRETTALQNAVLSIRRQNWSGVQFWKNTNHQKRPARRLENRGFFQRKST